MVIRLSGNVILVRLSHPRKASSPIRRTPLGKTTLFRWIQSRNECAKAIIQSGVKEVYYLSDKYADSMATLASKRMLMSAGVTFTKLKTDLDAITLSFIPEEDRK